MENVEGAFCKTRKIDAMLTYPNYELFVEEIGCNANQKDGHIAGTKYITKRNTGIKNVFYIRRTFHCPSLPHC